MIPALAALLTVKLGNESLNLTSDHTSECRDDPAHKTYHFRVSPTSLSSAPCLRLTGLIGPGGYRNLDVKASSLRPAKSVLTVQR